MQSVTSVVVLLHDVGRHSSDMPSPHPPTNTAATEAHYQPATSRSVAATSGQELPRHPYLCTTAWQDVKAYMSRVQQKQGQEMRAPRHCQGSNRQPSVLQHHCPHSRTGAADQPAPTTCDGTTTDQHTTVVDPSVTAPSTVPD